MKRNLEWLERKLSPFCYIDGGDPSGGSESSGSGPSGSTDPEPITGDRQTVLGSESKDSVPQTYPDDWRTKMVDTVGVEGSDKEKLMTRMDRFTDPGAVLKSMLDFEGVIKNKQGDWKPKIAEDATEEQLSEYRESMGVPQTVEGYFTGSPEGLILSDEDKVIAESFMEDAHAGNMSQKDVNISLQWYRKLQEQSEIARQQKDTETRENAENVLREEWGGEYTINKNMIGAMLNTFSPEAKNALSLGYAEDGTSLMNNPHVLRDMARLAREINPTGIVINGEIPTDLSSIEQKLDGYTKQMREDRRAWNKNTSGQKEYMQLLEQKERLAANQ